MIKKLFVGECLGKKITIKMDRLTEKRSVEKKPVRVRVGYKKNPF
jgi:hypothetical protein